MTKFARDNGFIGWFETSAKTNHNVDIAFQTLIQHILKVTKDMQVQTPASSVGNSSLNVLGQNENKKKNQSFEDYHTPSEQAAKGCCG